MESKIFEKRLRGRSHQLGYDTMVKNLKEYQCVTRYKEH